MILFTFEKQLNTSGQGRRWTLALTQCTDGDMEHEDEIYEQLDAVTVGLA